MIIFLYRSIAIITLFILTCSVKICAQIIPDITFGSIPDSIANMPPPSQNPDVPYMVTNNELGISFEEKDNAIFALLKHHVRLKVFDKTAREASIVSIPYYFKNNMETFSEIKGVTNLSSGKQVPLQKSNIRTININERYNVKEFSMPAVENGAVLDYSYKIKRRYIEELPDFYFSRKVPTSVAKITITYPNYLRYKPYFQNLEVPVKHNVTYIDTSSVPKMFMFPRPEPLLTEQWIAYSIPAVQEETYISSLNDYRGRVKFLLSEFGIPRQPLENNWDVVIAQLRKEMNPLSRIENNRLAKTMGDSMAQAKPDLSQKAIQDHIYAYLNQKSHFSGAFSPYSDVADSLVLSGKAVDQAAINQTLAAMLRGAGIEAYPLLISSRKSGKIDRDFPSFYQFDGQLVYSRIGDQTYIMDASFAHSQPALIPIDASNGSGLKLEPHSYQWIGIDARKSNFDIKVDLDAKLNRNGMLSGKLVSQQNGYAAQLIRQQKADGKSNIEILKRTLFDGFSQLTANDVIISQLHDFNKPVKITARFNIKNYAVSFTNGLKFSPMIVGARTKSPFEDTNRNLPITLNAPEKLDVSYSISLPRGYSLGDGKQNHSLTFPGAAFKEDYSMGGGLMKYRYQINISRKRFSVANFRRLDNFYERWATLSNTAWLIEKK